MLSVFHMWLLDLLSPIEKINRDWLTYEIVGLLLRWLWVGASRVWAEPNRVGPTLGPTFCHVGPSHVEKFKTGPRPAQAHMLSYQTGPCRKVQSRDQVGSSPGAFVSDRAMPKSSKQGPGPAQAHMLSWQADPSCLSLV